MKLVVTETKWPQHCRGFENGRVLEDRDQGKTRQAFFSKKDLADSPPWIP